VFEISELSPPAILTRKFRPTHDIANRILARAGVFLPVSDEYPFQFPAAQQQADMDDILFYCFDSDLVYNLSSEILARRKYDVD
jgi:hypothetical protein